MIIPKPETFDAFLPATKVTQRMRDQVAQIANDQGISMADVTRYALSLFLDLNVEKTDNESELLTQKEGNQHRLEA